ncbi:ribonuclease H-like domain-containing protein [Pelagophyceae sp. CCMP2097]|nr:ribonuclease H-like domain-containing protein [Pelagophyceae sp. CCMP2097]
MALDCEMVGVGHAGKESCLARCSVVDYAGRVVYDSHVRAPERVTDFRTQYSGVRAKDLKSSSAVDFKECQTAVAKLLEDAILVGHALHNDLKVLLLTHPPRMTRDTAKYKPLMKTNARGKHKPRKLRDLAKEHLDRTIQTGEHGSVEDAQTALDLYKMFSTQWEAGLRSEVR